jgi:hypothetical protein
MTINLVEMLGEEHHQSPCKFGNIVDHHACYCHHDNGPRKCPIWRNYGESAIDKWNNKGDWDNETWDGGCKFFVKS